MKTVFLKLERLESCRGHCWNDDASQPDFIDNLRLRPDDLVEIRGLRASDKPLNRSLAELVQALIDFNPRDLHVAFEERGQISIGQHLYQETLGRLNAYDGQKNIDLRIMTDDEHLGRLPWPLLAQRGLFMVNNGWSISLVTDRKKLSDVELPPSPKVLMIAPQPADLEITDGDEHRDALRRALGKFTPRMADADHFQVAANWEDFRDRTRNNQYDVVYYYGHGEGTPDQSRLLFESAGQRQPLPVTMRDFAEAMGRVQPKLIYLNCCAGDAGGLLGAGRQLAAVAPCVVTNRTIATVPAAKAQAMEFWKQVLLDGVTPHAAAARNYQSLGELGLSSLDPHWFTPVIYANYDKWSSNPPDRDQKYDHHWKLKLDRVDQFGRVVLKTQDALQKRRPRALAFLWYGEEGEGMERFHERLEVELQPRLMNAEVVSYRTRWPDRDDGDPQKSFSVRAGEEMLLEAFAVENLAQISGAVRGKVANARAIVVVNHPHSSTKEIHPQRLLEYLQWWNDYVVRQLDGDDHSYLLGFSYRTKDVDKFRNNLGKCGFDGSALNEASVDILQPLKSLLRHDLLEFIQYHEIFIPTDRRDHYLDYILERTKGHYEATILELEKLVAEGYDEVLHRESTSQSDSPDDPFAGDVD